jgi:uncharacterized protein
MPGLAELTFLGVWGLFFFWAMLLVLASLLVYLGLGGTMAVFMLALTHAVFTGFDPISWRLLALLGGLVVLAEGIEMLLGIFYTSKMGATRSGVIGAFLGGVIGAFAGSYVAPVFGTLMGGFFGAFSGAVLGEYIREKRIEESLRIGAHAFVGKLLAILFKHIVAMAMVGLILRATWPS